MRLKEDFHAVVLTVLQAGGTMTSNRILATVLSTAVASLMYYRVIVRYVISSPRDLRSYSLNIQRIGDEKTLMLPA